jgi:hypothetical protein
LVEAKDGNGAPLEALAVLIALACGEDERSLIVGEHPVHGNSAGAAGEFASPAEVAQHLIAATVCIRDRALTGHMPDDILNSAVTGGWSPPA